MPSIPGLHVAKLYYSLVKHETVSYENPAPIDFETDTARFFLAEGRLTCEMKIHTSSGTEARAVVEPAIRSWEVASDLKGNRGAFRLKYDRPEIVDRCPLEPGEGRAYITGAGAVSIMGAAIVHVTSNAYPDPPGAFRLNADAESMWLRYKGYLEGREPLLSMAYFCETVLETVAGGRNEAAKAFAVDVEVLRKVGELTSTRGDYTIARKACSNLPLSGHEAAWLEAAVKEIIIRVGDCRDCERLLTITLADLPPLS